MYRDILSRYWQGEQRTGPPLYDFKCWFLQLGLLSCIATGHMCGLPPFQELLVVMVATGMAKVNCDDKSMMVLQGTVQWVSEALAPLGNNRNVKQWDRAGTQVPA